MGRLQINPDWLKFYCTRINVDPCKKERLPLPKFMCACLEADVHWWHKFQGPGWNVIKYLNEIFFRKIFLSFY